MFLPVKPAFLRRSASLASYFTSGMLQLLVVSDAKIIARLVQLPMTVWSARKDTI